MGGAAHLVIVADDLLALLAGVGVQAVVAGDAVRFVLHLDVLASAQGLVAVPAVEAVAHDDDLLLSPTSCGAEGGFTGNSSELAISGEEGGGGGERGRGGGRVRLGGRNGKQDEGRQTTRGKGKSASTERHSLRSNGPRKNNVPKGAAAPADYLDSGSDAS